MRKILTAIIVVALSMSAGCAKTEVPAVTPAPTDEIITELPNMPMSFSFSSGSGGWSTDVLLQADGMFTGQFHDSDLGDIGDEYPNGTFYECLFSGKFTDIRKINDFEYAMTLENLDYDATKAETIVDGVKIVSTEPYGFDNASEFSFYLIGKDTSDLPPEFLDWARIAWDMGDTPDVLPVYGLYNIEGQQGFVSNDTADLL
ncbi:MAG: hypothetical protein LBM16_02350 [Clostridiales bacterium]|jgi:hypothetical protein|nr:hypothetical protein [Clostridiales bacterium]